MDPEVAAAEARPRAERHATGRRCWRRCRRCLQSSSTSRGRYSSPSSALGFPGWRGRRDTSAYTSFQTDSFHLGSWGPRHLRCRPLMSDRSSPLRQTRRLTSRTAKIGSFDSFRSATPHWRCLACVSAVRAARRRDEQRPAPPRRKRRSQIRRRWWRRRGRFSLEDVVSHVALPAVDVPVGVADVVVPDHRIHRDISGLHRRISRAPMARARWVLLGTSGPCTQWYGATRHCLRGAFGEPQAGERNARRHHCHRDNPFPIANGVHILSSLRHHLL